MSAKYTPGQFLEIANFISKQECEELLACRDEPETKWFGVGDESMDFRCGYKKLKHIHEKIKSLFNENEYEIMIFDVIQKSQNGVGLDMHQDDIGSPNISAGIILYLNEDFNGGYLVYPSIPMAVKPQAGTLVVHPGDVPHFVSMFNSNESRYYISCFATTITDSDML